MENAAHGFTTGLRAQNITDEEKLSIIRNSAAALKPILVDLIPLYHAQISQPLTQQEFESRFILVLENILKYIPERKCWANYVDPMFITTGSTVFNCCVFFTFLNFLQILVNSIEKIITTQGSADNVIAFIRDESLDMCIQARVLVTGKTPEELMKRVRMIYNGLI